MINIRPVSDLKDKFPEIEETVAKSNSPVFLTENGYGTMVLLSIEHYSDLTDDIGRKLNEADTFAEISDRRLSGSEVFSKARAELINNQIQQFSQLQIQTRIKIRYVTDHWQKI